MLMRYVLLALLTLTVLDGCRHRHETAGTTASEAPRVTARRTRRLMAIASRDLGCPADQLADEQVTDRIYRVRGCGDWRDYAIFGGRRARWRRIMPIADRAQADFGCPATTINFTPTSPTTYTAMGCGKAAGYELRCTDRDCGWVGAELPSGTVAASASVVIIVPIDGATLSLDVDGETDDEGEE